MKLPQAQRDLGRLVHCPECGGRGSVEFNSTSKWGRVMVERATCSLCWGFKRIYEAERLAWDIAHTDRAN